MAVLVRLENLPRTADSLDIRRFFYGLSIPPDGIKLVRGQRHCAFISFNSVEEGNAALNRDGEKIGTECVKLYKSDYSEYENFVKQAHQYLYDIVNSRNTDQRSVPEKGIGNTFNSPASSVPQGNANFNVMFGKQLTLPAQPVLGKKRKNKRYKPPKLLNVFQWENSSSNALAGDLSVQHNAKIKLQDVSGRLTKHKPFINYCVQLSGFPPTTTFMEVQELLKNVFIPQHNLRWLNKGVVYGVDLRTIYVQLCNKDDFEEVVSKKAYEFPGYFHITVEKCSDELFFKKFCGYYEPNEAERFSHFIGKECGLWCRSKGWPENTQASDIQTFFLGLKISNLVILYHEKDLCFHVCFVEFATPTDHRLAFDRNGKRAECGRFIELFPTTLSQIDECKTVAPYVYELIRQVPQQEQAVSSVNDPDFHMGDNDGLSKKGHIGRPVSDVAGEAMEQQNFQEGCKINQEKEALSGEATCQADIQNVIKGNVSKVTQEEKPLKTRKVMFCEPVKSCMNMGQQNWEPKLKRSKNQVRSPAAKARRAERYREILKKRGIIIENWNDASNNPSVVNDPSGDNFSGNTSRCENLQSPSQNQYSSPIAKALRAEYYGEFPRKEEIGIAWANDPSGDASSEYASADKNLQPISKNQLRSAAARSRRSKRCRERQKERRMTENSNGSLVTDAPSSDDFSKRTSAYQNLQFFPTDVCAKEFAPRASHEQFVPRDPYEEFELRGPYEEIASRESYGRLTPKAYCSDIASRNKFVIESLSNPFYGPLAADGPSVGNYNKHTSAYELTPKSYSNEFTSRESEEEFALKSYLREFEPEISRARRTSFDDFTSLVPTERFTERKYLREYTPKVYSDEFASRVPLDEFPPRKFTVSSSHTNKLSLRLPFYEMASRVPFDEIASSVSEVAPSASEKVTPRHFTASSSNINKVHSRTPFYELASRVPYDELAPSVSSEEFTTKITSREFTTKVYSNTLISRVSTHDFSPQISSEEFAEKAHGEKTLRTPVDECAMRVSSESCMAKSYSDEIYVRDSGSTGVGLYGREFSPQTSFGFSEKVYDEKTSSVPKDEFTTTNSSESSSNITVSRIVDAYNIHPSIRGVELLNFFRGFGLADKDIIRRYTERGEPTGNVRVTFPTENDAKNAMRLLNNSQLGGLPVRLAYV